MADDPRQQLIDRALGDGWFPGERRELLAELDRADPLRALLADEDRAVELIATTIAGDARQPEALRREAVRNPAVRSAARAVLAALREVAGL